MCYRNRTIMAALTGVLLSILVAGCGRRESGQQEMTRVGPPPSVPPATKITVCLLPKKKGLPYFSSCADGAREAARELGNVNLIYDGPTDGSPEKAASMIEKWTLKHVDVIAVSPNDQCLRGLSPEVSLSPWPKRPRSKA